MEATALIVLGLFALAIAVVAYQRYQEKIRARWARMAALSGLTYTRSDPWLEGLPFDLLQAGDGRAVDHILAGTYGGVDLRAFEYHYYDETTDSEGRTSRTHHRFTCCVVPCDLDAPHLKISRESLLTKLADAIGFDDIAFESEEFNRAYQITAEDRRFASYVIDARMMEHLLTIEGFAFEIRGGHILAATKRIAVEEIRSVMDAALGLCRRLPRAALDTYGKHA